MKQKKLNRDEKGDDVTTDEMVMRSYINVTYI